MKYSLLLLAAACLWSGEESTRTIERSFALTGNSRSVFVCGVNGSLNVTAGGGNEVRFSVREKLAAPTTERLQELKRESDVVFTQEAGVVRAGVKGPWSDSGCSRRDIQNRREGRRRWEGRDTRIEHEFTVTVPRDVRLELRTVNGGIRVTGTVGAYSVNTVNGGIHMIDGGLTAA